MLFAPDIDTVFEIMSWKYGDDDEGDDVDDDDDDDDDYYYYWNCFPLVVSPGTLGVDFGAGCILWFREGEARDQQGCLSMQPGWISPGLLLLFDCLKWCVSAIVGCEFLHPAAEIAQKHEGPHTAPLVHNSDYLHLIQNKLAQKSPRIIIEFVPFFSSCWQDVFLSGCYATWSNTNFRTLTVKLESGSCVLQGRGQPLNNRWISQNLQPNCDLRKERFEVWSLKLRLLGWWRLKHLFYL